MKTTLNRITLLLACMLCTLGVSFGQEDLSGKIVRVIKQDGNVLIGELASDDGREILLITEELGKIYIPKHQISKIVKVEKKDMRQDEFVGEDRFATRYFLTTNGLPIKKGEHYGMVSIYGPEVHFAFANNVSVGLLTTWIASPVIGSVKYSFQNNPDLKISASVGVLGGALTFFGGYGGLGYGALTFGDRKANLTLSAGYAGVSDGNGNGGTAPLMSVAGMYKVDDKFTLVGDSFIYMGNIGENNGGNWAIIMPGFRYSRTGRTAFQFGIAGLVLPQLRDFSNLPIAPFPVGNIFFSL